MKISTDTFSINRAFDEAIKDFRRLPETIPLRDLLPGFHVFSNVFSKIHTEPLGKASFSFSHKNPAVIPPVFHLHFFKGNEGKTFIRIDNFIPNNWILCLCIMFFFALYSIIGSHDSLDEMLFMLLFFLFIFPIGVGTSYLVGKKSLMDCLTRVLCVDSTFALTRIK